MGEKLVKYYKFIFEKKGFIGRTQLAQKTTIPSIVAATTEETPEILEKFKLAINQITGELPPD